MYLFVILILRRDHARTLLESPPERTDRMESGTFGNLLYTGIRLGIHQALAFLDPELVDIIGERLSQLPVKQLGKIRSVANPSDVNLREDTVFLFQTMHLLPLHSVY